jgi:tetratricopeptide (TPR) repeat protein
MHVNRFLKSSVVCFILLSVCTLAAAGTLPVPDENSALKKINDAKDPAAKLEAAAQFIKQYPKSEKRLEVAKYIAGNIGSVTDYPERIKLAERFLTIFNAPGEAELITEALIDAYVMVSRTSDAFRLADGWLQKNPDDVDLLRRLAIVASNEAIKGNNDFVKQGQDYGRRAIAQIEADRMPATMDATKWTEYKTKNLAALYREVGILAMRVGDKATVKSSMEKAAELKSTDPAVYILLSQLANDEYQEQVKRYQSAFGPQKEAEHQRSLTLLDRVIEVYAQAVAMAEANPQYAKAATELRGDLEGYYKFRHDGSTDGLQGLIDKYKRP